MLRPALPGVLLALALAACHAPAAPTASPTHRATATPRVATASATPTAPPASEGPTTTLAGTVRLDPDTLIAAGAGKLVGERGNGYVAVNAGSLIGDAGGGLISDQGGTLVANNAGNLIGPNGASLMTGGNSGTLIANNAGNLLAPNGASYHVQAAGDLVPVAGMAIVPVDLAAGRVIGRVFFTDATGAFSARIPAALAGNVALAAVVPARDAQDPVLADPRLAFSLIVPVKGGAPAALDEDTAVVATYLRSCFAGRLELAFGSDDFDATLDAIGGARKLVGPLKATVLDVAKQLRARAQAASVDRLAPAARARLARRVAAAILSHVDLATVKLDSALSPAWKGPPEPALDALTGFMAVLRAHVAGLLAADSRAFAGKAYLAGAQVTRPSDLGRFFVATYLSGTDLDGINKVGDVLDDLDARYDPATKLDQEERLRAAFYATIGAIGQTLVLDEQARTDAFSLIDQAKN
ncbi:MAG: hypothetical protein JWM80_2732 [Cyanobacteria bacterium RYN_339]|nr:hypothetical protein [Cyanobacteria bacterium RYN_339]